MTGEICYRMYFRDEKLMTDRDRYVTECISKMRTEVDDRQGHNSRISCLRCMGVKRSLSHRCRVFWIFEKSFAAGSECFRWSVEVFVT